MDTMKFLLGATAALLLGAIVVSWQGMQRGVENASPEEIEQLQQQIAELKAELEKSNQAATGQTPPPPVELTIEEQLAEAQRKLAELEANQPLIDDPDNNQADLDARLKRDEEGLIAQKMLEKGDDELRRARLISQALLVGRVTDYVDDPQYGGFITMEVLMPEQVQAGSIVGIRRNNTGILYRFKVSDVTPEGAIANPITKIGEVKPERGDELIFPPQY